MKQDIALEKVEVVPVDEKPKVVGKPKVDVMKFKERRLKAINTLSDPAKAKAIADRILRNH